MNNLTFTDGAIRSEKSKLMTKYNPEIQTNGEPINKNVQSATRFQEIPDSERERVADELASLVEDTHSELFGRDDE
jgi:hypothetical protein